MADYQVNLELAIRGAKDLQRTRVETKRLQKEVDIFNRRVRKAFPASVKNFNNLSKEVSRARRTLNEAAIGTDHFMAAIENLVKVETAHEKITKKKDRTIKAHTMSVKDGISLSRAKIKVLQEEARAENKLLRAKLQTSGMGSALRRGIGSAVGSGIIGGGFPLLFGQGPLAAASGLAGGVAGGALAAIPGMGQFGFALSIAGTAIGSAMEDLTQALKKPEENIENLVNKLGLVGTPTGELALKLEKMGLKSSAAQLLLEKFNEKMGTSPEELLATTKKLEEFKNKINELGTEITLFLSSVLIPFIEAIGGALDTGKLLRMLKQQEGTNFFQTQQAIVNKANERAAAQFKTNQAMGVKNAPSFTQLRDENIDILLKEALGLPSFDEKSFTPQAGGTPPPGSNLPMQTFQDREIKPLQQALVIEENRLNMSGERLNILKEQFELDNLNNELALLKSENEKLSTDELTQQIQKLEAQVGLQKQVLANAKALIDPFRQISDMIQIEMGNGIKDLIKGTRTLNDVMRNMLNKMADAFLNLAIFGNIGGSSITGGLLGGLFGKRAEGGPVKAGGSYIVGERGPELFRPSASGNIIPNDALGGSTNIVVNVDASGSAVEGDEDRGRELGRLISVAVQSEIIQQKRPGGLLA